MKFTPHRNTFVRTVSATVLASTVALLSACGGGGGGAAPPAGPMPLATGSFTKTLELDGAVGINPDIFSSTNAFRHYQWLMRSQDMNGSGYITGISFRRNVDMPASVSCPNMTIKLGHSTVSNLTTNMAAGGNVEQGAGSLQTVLNNTTINIPAGAQGSYFRIDFAAPFHANGVNNLVVDMTRTSACTGTAPIRANSSTSAYTAYAYSVDPATPDTAFSTGVSLANSMLHFSGGDNKQNYGGSASNFWPFANTTGLRIQTLYLASDIQGSGPITGIAFQTNGTTVAGAYTYTLRLGHSTLSALGTNFANNYSGPPATVGNAVSFTIPAGVPSGEWVWVPIPDGVFTYNGTDNLIVDVSTTAGDADNAMRYTTIANRRIWANGATATTGNLDFSVYHIALRFHGGAVTVMSTGINSSDSHPFGSGAGGSSKRQYLYRMSELGTGGRITSVACRLDNATSGTTAATSYANFEVVLGHTTNNTLSTAFANNMTDATTVFTGTYPLAAGQRAGDWIEIPLTTSFTYDPTRNLVVQISGDGAANSYRCDAKGDSTLYLSRHAFASTRTATTGAVNSYQNELKLNISK